MYRIYPEIEPYDHGMLDVGEGNQIYLEVCGNPDGKPALVLHGGPGSGCTLNARRNYDPARYKIVLFDQRNCGRSLPSASEPSTDLAANTTQNLVADIEKLRAYLGIERWLVWGGSWGSTLALAYATSFPQHVSEMILCGVTTGRYSEVDWLFRGGVSIFFPEQWQRLNDALPLAPGEKHVTEACYRLLQDSDPAVRQHAAYEWCLWDTCSMQWPPVTGLPPRFQDPAFQRTFARLVTHYVVHDQFLRDNELMDLAGRLADIPGVLLNGGYDFQSPIGNAWALQQVWLRAELIVIDDAGHGPNENFASALVEATNRFARQR